MNKKILFLITLFGVLLSSNISLAGYAPEVLMWALEEGDVYDEFCNVTFVCRKDNYNIDKYGAIDEYGNEVIPVKYGYIEHDIYHRANKIVTVSLSLVDKCAFFDLINNKSSMPEYDGINSGLGDNCENIVVNKNGKWGIIDLDCNELVPIKYDEILYYSDDEIIVILDGKYGVIRIDNSICVPIIYDYLNGCNNDPLMFSVRLNEKEGIVAENNKIVLPLEFEDVRYEDNLGFVKKNGKWGVIDLKTLTYVMRPTYKYDDIYSWSSSTMALGNTGKSHWVKVVKDKSIFKDVPITHWGYKQIDEMKLMGKISGFEDGTFRPDETVTREQFVTILANTLHLTNSSSIEFIDVETNRWSKQYIDVTSQYLEGKVENNQNYFMPDKPAVREDVVVAIVKAMGLEEEKADLSLLNKFSDKNLISNNAKKYVCIALENGIVKGNADGTFNPKGYLTRAEIAALMRNIDSETIMPDVEGISVEDAEDILNEKGIRRVISKEYDDVIEKDVVISQSILAGRTFNKNMENIEIKVSAGPEYIIMKDLTGRYSEEGAVEKYLNKNGLEYVIIEEKSDEMPYVGGVIRTEPKAGEKFRADTKIKVFVSSGYENKDNIYREMSFKTNMAYYIWDDESVNVKVVIKDAKGKKVVYEGICTRNDYVEYPVVGYGDITTELYINGELKSTEIDTVEEYFN